MKTDTPTTILATNCRDNKPTDTLTFEASEWRNLEPCEIIQDGDEVLSSKNGWIKARRIGQHPFKQSIYRTRKIAHEEDRIKQLEDEVERLKAIADDAKCDLIRTQIEMQLEIDRVQAEVKRLTNALESCWHAANTYDGNYTRACDNVITIVNTTLKIANPEK